MASLRTRRFLPVALVAALGLVGGGCSQDGADRQAESQLFAAEVIAAVGVIEPTDDSGAEVDVPPGCVIVTEEDGYGFPIDVMKCGADVPPPADPGSDLTFAGWVGSAAAHKLAGAVRDVLVLQTACNDGAAIADLRRLVADVPGDVRLPLEQAAAELGRAALACNIDPAAWRDHTDLAIAHLRVFVTAADEARLAAAASASGNEVDDG